MNRTIVGLLGESLRLALPSTRYDDMVRGGARTPPPTSSLRSASRPPSGAATLSSSQGLILNTNIPRDWRAPNSSRLDGGDQLDTPEGYTSALLNVHTGMLLGVRADSMAPGDAVQTLPAQNPSSHWLIASVPPDRVQAELLEVIMSRRTKAQAEIKAFLAGAPELQFQNRSWCIDHSAQANVDFFRGLSAIVRQYRAVDAAPDIFITGEQAMPSRAEHACLDSPDGLTRRTFGSDFPAWQAKGPPPASAFHATARVLAVRDALMNPFSLDCRIWLYVFDSHHGEHHEKRVVFTLDPVEGSRPVEEPFTGGRFEPKLDSVYTLTNAHTAHLLRVVDGSMDEGAKVHQWSELSGDAESIDTSTWWQLVRARPEADGNSLYGRVYTLVNMKSGHKLGAIHDGHSRDGAELDVITSKCVPRCCAYARLPPLTRLSQDFFSRLLYRTLSKPCQNDPLHCRTCGPL